MKKVLKYLLISCLLYIIGVNNAFSQVSFSYSTPPVYTVGTAITPLSPTVTSGYYGAASSFASVSNTDACYYSSATGDIYSTSSNTNNVYIYNSSGTLLFTGSGSTYGYSYPEGIVTDASGNTYVASYTNGAVKKLTTGGVETSITGFTNPVGEAFDAAGNLYVTDHTTGNVYKIAAGGTTASVFLTGFNVPWGIAIDASGNMFVAESGANDVIKIANAISGSTTKTTLATGFNSPRCLAFDGAGNLFVADCYNSAIKEISSGGTVTTVVSSASYNSVVGVTFDASNNLYMASYGNSTIYKFAPLSYSVSPALPAGLSINSYTGVISGTPTACCPATTYTITANNGTNSNTATISLTILPNAPTVTGSSNCGAGSITLTAGAETPGGGTYNWYNASSGGTALQATSSNTYTAYYVVSSTLYVSYTSSGAESARTAVTATVNPAVASPLSGTIVAYPFNGNANDISGNNDNGIPEPSAAAGPTLTTDRFGAANSAYSFNGSTQYFTSTTAFADLQFFTISIWFNTTVAGGKLIGYGASQTGSSTYFDRHLYMANTGQLYFGIYNGGYETINTSASYNDGNWHHAVVSVGPTYGTRLFVDNVLQASNSSYTTPEVRTSYWRVGYDNLVNWPSAPSNYYFTGKLDDIAIYNTELTTAQITTTDNLDLIGTTTPACSGNAVTLTAQAITGATYSWTDGTNTVTGNPATFTTASTGSYTLTVTPGSGSCTSTATVNPGTGPVYTWTGAAGTTDPTNGTNWTYTTANSVGQGPTFNGTENLVIPSGLTHYPSLTANESIYDLTIASGASLNLNGHTLSMGCNIFNSSGGQILYGSNSSSNLTWNGSVLAQSYTGGTTTNTAQLANMTINNSAGGTVTISGGPVDIYYTLTLTKGNLAIGASPAALTLKSTATQTASVAVIPTGYSITGNVTAERFVTGGTTYSSGRWVYRNYRLMSSPVNEGVDASSNYPYSLNYLGASTIISDCATTYAASNHGNPSLYLFNEKYTPNSASFISGNFIGVTNVSSTVASGTISTTDATNSTGKMYVGDGYMMYFRGNNINNLTGTPSKTTYPYVAPENVTFSTTGTLNQGTYSVVSWTGYAGLLYTNSNAGNVNIRGFNLVGNPYPSSIDWSTFSNSSSSAAIYGAHVNPSIYIFDPVTGNYDTYSATTHVATGNASNVIPSGQGFFVQANAASPTLKFNESAKTSAQVSGSNLLLGTPDAQTAYSSYLKLRLVTDSLNHDDMLLGFNSTSTPYFNPQEDAEFLSGMNQLQTIMCITKDSIKATAKWVAPPKSTADEVIKLRVWGQNKGVYTIQRTDFKAIPAIYEVWLMDNLKKDSLDLRANTNYAFDLDPNDTTTFGSNRFTVVIRENQALAFHLLNFTAVKAGGSSSLVWVTENEQNYTSFTVQRSTDGGKTFTVLGGQTSSGIGTYSYIDTTPATGANMYRVMIQDLNGTISYTNVITLTYGSTIASAQASSPITIYPNPAQSTINMSIQSIGHIPSIVHSTNSALTLNANTGTTGSGTSSYSIKITNNTGYMIKQDATTSASWQADISSLLPGVYVIQVVDNNTKVLVGSGTFVKL